MMNFTPVVLVSEKKKVRKEIPGPSAETLMLIRYFARIYEYNPERIQKARKIYVN